MDALNRTGWKADFQAGVSPRDDLCAPVGLGLKAVQLAICVHTLSLR